MDNSQQNQTIEELQDTLEAELFARHGMLMTSDALISALGYVSEAAWRQSLVRKTVPIPVFKIEHRRGKFALVKDVARFLAEKRCQSTYNEAMKGGE